jgi:hypothetical protein
MAQASVFDEIKNAIENLTWGSVEVIVQDGEVTQISTRIIKKTSTFPKKATSKNHVNKSSEFRKNTVITV